MGNVLLKCKGSSNKEPENDEDFDDGALIANNRDNYFTRENFEEIMKKFPEYKEWINQSSLNMSKSRTPKQRKIKWKEGEAIGNGSFGRVIMGLNLQKGYIMAVKQVQIGAANTPAQQERIKALEMEIELLSQLSHKNIVRYYGSNKTKTTFNIFLEFISGGTIASLIEKYGPLTENLTSVYTKQILEGLEYLHVRNTIHRDIKGANVLVNNSGVVKLADFGTAKRISAIADNEAKAMPSIRGTVNWMAPEVIKQTNLGRASDIWSVGCTVLEMLTGKAPWAQLMKAGSTQVSALYQIAKSKTHPPIPETLSPDAVDFLKQCFKINPAERPNVIKLLKHKFITGFEVVSKAVGAANEPKGKVQTPTSTKSKKHTLQTFFGSIKSNEALDKAEGSRKEKEKEKHKGISEPQKPSFMKYMNSQEVDHIDSLTVTDKLHREKSEGRGSPTARETESNNTVDNKLNDTSKKPRYTIKSINENHNLSNLNLELTNEKSLKEARTLSSPAQEVVRYKKSSMDDSNHYHEEAPTLQKSSSESRKPEETLTTAARPESEMNTRRSPRSRPLGKNRGNTFGEDGHSNGNDSIVSGKSAGEDTNVQRARKRSLLAEKDGHIRNDKDTSIIQEFVEEEENKSGDRAKHKLENHNDENEVHPRRSESPNDRHRESKVTDSDCEISMHYQYQNRVSTSIKTVYVPEGNGESTAIQKRMFSLKHSPSRHLKSTNERLKEKRAYQDGIVQPSFDGIKLTESVVVPKSKGNTTEEAAGNDEKIQRPYYLKTGLHLKKKNDGYLSQKVESMLLGESVVSPTKDTSKHIMNNLMHTESEGVEASSGIIMSRAGLDHGYDGLHRPYSEQEHVQ